MSENLLREGMDFGELRQVYYGFADFTDPPDIPKGLSDQDIRDAEHHAANLFPMLLHVSRNENPSLQGNIPSLLLEAATAAGYRAGEEVSLGDLSRGDLQKKRGDRYACTLVGERYITAAAVMDEKLGEQVRMAYETAGKNATLESNLAVLDRGSHRVMPSKFRERVDAVTSQKGNEDSRSIAGFVKDLVFPARKFEGRESEIFNKGLSFDVFSERFRAARFCLPKQDETTLAAFDKVWDGVFVDRSGKPPGKKFASWIESTKGISESDWRFDRERFMDEPIRSDLTLIVFKDKVVHALVKSGALGGSLDEVQQHASHAVDGVEYYLGTKAGKVSREAVAAAQKASARAAARVDHTRAADFRAQFRVESKVREDPTVDRIWADKMLFRLLDLTGKIIHSGAEKKSLPSLEFAHALLTATDHLFTANDLTRLEQSKALQGRTLAHAKQIFLERAVMPFLIQTGTPEAPLAPDAEHVLVRTRADSSVRLDLDAPHASPIGQEGLVYRVATADRIPTRSKKVAETVPVKLGSMTLFVANVDIEEAAKPEKKIKSTKGSVNRQSSRARTPAKTSRAALRNLAREDEESEVRKGKASKRRKTAGKKMGRGGRSDDE
ncbi:hypothetical protein M1555_02020 [Patescibacteria group bacterium]|nr:hypothetical protein [Patescibacteria group bacterium]